MTILVKKSQQPPNIPMGEEEMGKLKVGYLQLACLATSLIELLIPVGLSVHLSVTFLPLALVFCSFVNR